MNHNHLIRLGNACIWCAQPDCKCAKAPLQIYGNSFIFSGWDSEGIEPRIFDPAEIGAALIEHCKKWCA